MLPARPPQEEVQYQTKEFLWTNQVQIYINANCDEKGYIKADNMTRQERRGHRKLLKRRAKGTIIFSKTDKSAKNTVSSTDSYLEHDRVHIKKTHWTFFDKAWRSTLAHMKCMASIFKVGSSHSEEEAARLKKAMHEESSIIPNLILNQKDHKPLGKDVLPKTSRSQPMKPTAQKIC